MENMIREWTGHIIGACREPVKKIRLGNRVVSVWPDLVEGIFLWNNQGAARGEQR
jgi:hypothetical protein